jgi:hypothetical protein
MLQREKVEAVDGLWAFGYAVIVPVEVLDWLWGLKFAIVTVIAVKRDPAEWQLWGSLADSRY